MWKVVYALYLVAASNTVHTCDQELCAAQGKKLKLKMGENEVCLCCVLPLACTLHMHTHSHDIGSPVLSLFQSFFLCSLHHIHFPHDECTFMFSLCFFFSSQIFDGFTTVYSSCLFLFHFRRNFSNFSCVRVCVHAPTLLCLCISRWMKCHYIIQPKSSSTLLLSSVKAFRYKWFLWIFHEFNVYCICERPIADACRLSVEIVRLHMEIGNPIWMPSLRSIPKNVPFTPAAGV